MAQGLGMEQFQFETIPVKYSLSLNTSLEGWEI